MKWQTQKRNCDSYLIESFRDGTVEEEKEEKLFFVVYIYISIYSFSFCSFSFLSFFDCFERLSAGRKLTRREIDRRVWYGNWSAQSSGYSGTNGRGKTGTRRYQDRTSITTRHPNHYRTDPFNSNQFIFLFPCKIIQQLQSIRLVLQQLAIINQVKAKLAPDWTRLELYCHLIELNHGLTGGYWRSLDENRIRKMTSKPQINHQNKQINKQTNKQLEYVPKTQV